LTPERWAQIEELFHRASECDPNQRATLLDENCQGDLELRQEVESLLRKEAGSGSLLRAAVHSELEGFGFSLIGEVISHYRILDGLGGGGMGLVYRAEDVKLGRQVALKFLPEESAKDPAALGRFEREARAASALEHPNICPIYEFGEHEGQPFLVMQLLEGQTLRELLVDVEPGKPALPLERLLNLAIQIADGLEAAHKRGIIHRDVKPANIFITSEAQAKILDFGLSKLAHPATEGAGESEDSRNSGSKGTVREVSLPATIAPSLSRTGVAMGTAGYMSPQQVLGEKLDARTDLFSFGLVLYEMATGQRAFTGDSWPVLQEAILKQVPTPARQLNPELPVKLERIIQRALEKACDVRYQTAAAVRDDLEALKRDIESKSLARWGRLTASAAVLLIASTIFWIARRQPLSLTKPTDLKIRQLTNNSVETPVTSGAISPDGKYLAYSDVKGMHIQLIDTGELHSLPQPEPLKNDPPEWEIIPGAWFPDSTGFLANAHPAEVDASRWSSENTSIWEVSVSGGVPHKIRDNAIAWSVSPAGSLITFGTNKGKLGEREIWLMEKNGERPRKLLDTDENSTVGGTNWSPDGHRFIYLRSDKSGDTFLSRDVTGGPPLTLFTPTEMKNVVDGTWLPDGRLIYAVKEPQPGGDICNYWVMSLDSHTGVPVEKPRQLTHWAGFWMNNTSVTKDGKRLAFQESRGHSTGYVADLEAGGTRIRNSRPFTLEEWDVVADWTADSKAALVVRDRGAHYEFSKQFLNSLLNPLVLSTGEGSIEAAAITPDGKWVIYQLFAPEGESNPRLMRVPFSGGSPELLFSVPPGSGFSCSRHPSDLCVLAERSVDRNVMLVSVLDPIRGKRGPELTRFDLDRDLSISLSPFCAISPDGTRLAISRGTGGPIQILSLRGRPTQILQVKGLSDMRLLGWTGEGNGLFIVNGIRNGTVLQHVDLQGHPHVLWKCGTGWQCDFSPSPDGRHVAIMDRRTSSNFWMMENF